MNADRPPVKQDVDLSHEAPTPAAAPMIGSTELGLELTPRRGLRFWLSTSGAVRTAVAFAITTGAACLATGMVIIIGTVTDAGYEQVMRDMKVFGLVTLGAGLILAPIIDRLLRPR